MDVNSYPNISDLRIGDTSNTEDSRAKKRPETLSCDYYRDFGRTRWGQTKGVTSYYKKSFTEVLEHLKDECSGEVLQRNITWFLHKLDEGLWWGPETLVRSEKSETREGMIEGRSEGPERKPKGFEDTRRVKSQDGHKWGAACESVRYEVGRVEESRVEFTVK